MKTAVVLLFSILLVAGTVMAENSNGPIQVVIKAGKKGDVEFPHNAHQRVLGDCNKCHNLFPQKKGSIDELMAAGKLAKKQIMNQCRDCHSERKKAGRKTGPTNCAKCHGAK